jgi:hypothetical protein
MFKQNPSAVLIYYVEETEVTMCFTKTCTTLLLVVYFNAVQCKRNPLFHSTVLRIKRQHETNTEITSLSQLKGALLPAVIVFIVFERKR